jgi:AraC family transcriptional regulator
MTDPLATATTADRAPGSPVHVPWVDRMLAVLDHIHAHLDAELDPRDLARLAGFSPHYFHRVFRGMLGESVMEHVRRLRLERAALRLKHGTEPVTVIALDSGYGSHEAFTRAFRDRFGVAPRDFRSETQPTSTIDGLLVLRDEPPRTLLTVRHVGPYDGVAVAWDALFAFAIPHGLVQGPPLTMGFVHDDSEITAPTQCRYEAALVLADGVPVPDARTLPSGVAVRTLAAGRWACMTHVGPFDTIQATYDALLGRALPRRGLDLADEPTLEISTDDPRVVPPAELRTEIRVRLA